MRKTTRIMSLLLTLAMIITMAVPMTVSAAFTDVDSNHVYYEAINNLSAEGILNGFEDGSFKPGDSVTRAQFTKIMCYALSVGNLTYSDAERSIFTDVAPQHWAANNIVTAYRQKIINGMGDGTFAPEANVNYEQAVKMVVCALGFEQSALNLGGYPQGYLSVANSRKITAGIVDSGVGQAMNRGAVAKLIDNMLNTELYDEDGMGTGGTIRDEVSTAKKVSAKLIAGYGVALYEGVSPCYKNQIQLELREGDEEDELFIISEIENFDINKYLGRYVTVYYETEQGSSDKVVTSISLQSKKNEEIEIDLDAISKYDSSSIEYYIDAEQTETETVYYSSPDVLFNGEYPKEEDGSILSVKDLLDANHTKSGSITLISSDSSGVADVVFIKAYDLLIVSHTVKSNKMVYSKNAPYTSGLVIDTEDRTKNVKLTKGGKNVSITSLKQNDILSVAVSLSGDVIDVLVSDKSVASGIIISTDDSSAQITLDSGSKTYTLLSNVYTPIGTPSDIVVGKHISLYIDAFNKGAMVVFTEEKAFEYGYLSALQYDVRDAEMSAMIYKAAASNSTLSRSEYHFADRIKINGETMTLDGDIEEIAALLRTDAAASKPTGTASANVENDTNAQPIRFTVNTAGKINAITTVSSTSTQEASKLKIATYAPAGLECTMTGAKLGEYTISSETKIICVPENRTTGTYYSKTNSFFKKDKSYYVQIVNATSTKLAKCIYYYGEVGGTGADISSQITEETPLMIVKAISGVNVDNSTKKFTLVNVATGADTVCYDNAIAETGTLTVGDVIRVAITERDVYSDNDEKRSYPFIEALQVLADAESVVAGTYSPLVKTDGDVVNGVYDFRTLIGTVKEKEGGRIIIVHNISADKENDDVLTGTEESCDISSAKIYMVDTTVTQNDQKVRPAESTEFNTYRLPGIPSRIMINTRKTDVVSIIIFK